MTGPVVRTRGGAVRGAEHDGVRAFSGIPFARLAHRFAVPEPAEWAGVHDATRPGAAPWQVAAAWQSLPVPAGDDALNLTVWAPAVARDLPVVVWVYGGGFESGTNADPVTDGSRMAGEGFVVVALNYRVGAYGWAQLDHRGGRLANAGNLGLRDAIAALDWVRSAIDRFGGDPGRVTVVGESAGGFLAAALLAAPAARGLFSGLALFSGGASRLVRLGTARRIGDALLDRLGVADDPERILEAAPRIVLREQNEVIARDIGERNAADVRAYGVVEDSAGPAAVLADHPLAAVIGGTAPRVPVLTSTTRDEVAQFRRFARDFDPSDLETLVAEVAGWGVPGERAASIVDAYGAENDSPGAARAALLTDWIYRLPSARLAQAVAATGGTAHLAIVGRAGEELAGHAVDVPAILGSVAAGPPQARSRAAEIHAAVVGFARDGEPGWPPVGARPVTRVLGPDPLDGTAMHQQVLERWDGIDRP